LGASGGALLFALQNTELSGPVNVVAPETPSNAQFSKALGRALGRPSWLPAPAFALRLLLGEMSEMLLGGTSVEPRKLREYGYSFRRPELGPALASLV
jgi:NAD dependent epimerase/dehydratase family enzyme